MQKISLVILFFILCSIVSNINGNRRYRRPIANFLQIRECSESARRKLKRDEWNLLILHTNDMHSRFVETDAKQNECPKKLKKQKKCYGGMARVAAVVRKARKDATRGGPPVLFLVAGDTFSGSPWFLVHKAPLVAFTLNFLRPDATSLGNHEFDLGSRGLETYLNLTRNYRIVATNIDVSKEPGLKNQKLLKKSVVYRVRGHLVGIIGYVLPETKALSVANNITFYNEIEEIRKEAKRLQRKGVKILIALGHSGYEMDKKIAAEVEEIDAVVGGHTNTFLWNGNQPDIEKPKDLYPVQIKQNKTRKIVPVVQAYAHTKYIGRLILTFNKFGRVVRSCGQPLLLDHKIPRARDIVNFMKFFKGPVDDLSNEVIGQSIELDVNECKKKECDLGNLITQAMLEDAYKFLKIDNTTQQVPDTQLANTKSTNYSDLIVLLNGGGIRNPLTPQNGKVTFGMILSVLPFGSTIFKCIITGKQLKEMLEWGVERYGNVSRGEFPQVANLNVTYNLALPEKNRVTRIQIKVLNRNYYKNYTENDRYVLITSSYVAQGGDGYKQFLDPSVKKENLGSLDSRVLADYIKKTRNITQEYLKNLRGRIHIVKHN